MLSGSMLLYTYVGDTSTGLSYLSVGGTFLGVAWLFGYYGSAFHRYHNPLVLPEEPQKVTYTSNPLQKRTLPQPGSRLIGTKYKPTDEAFKKMVGTEGEESPFIRGKKVTRLGAEEPGDEEIDDLHRCYCSREDLSNTWSTLLDYLVMGLLIAMAVLYWGYASDESLAIPNRANTTCLT